MKQEPGVKVLSSERWWGPGYCGVCGTRDETELLPRAVRYWDPDDGWKMGVLCEGCTEECYYRGPRPSDYAVVTRHEDGALSADEKIDLLVELEDLDGVYADMGDDRR